MKIMGTEKRIFLCECGSWYPEDIADRVLCCPEYSQGARLVEVHDVEEN